MDPYNAGQEAYWDRLNSGSNPHDEGTEAHGAWRDGFFDAMFEDEGDRRMREGEDDET